MKKEGGKEARKERRQAGNLRLLCGSKNVWQGQWTAPEPKSAVRNVLNLPGMGLPQDPFCAQTRAAKNAEEAQPRCAPRSSVTSSVGFYTGEGF